MNELKFRDGTRVVPDNVADMMSGMETYKLTYQEALVEMNKRIEREYLNQAQQAAISAHFRVR